MSSGIDGFDAKPKRYRSRWERYAIVPLAILESELSDGAKVAYAYCDAIQGKDGKPAKGTDACAKAIHQSPSTFLKNIRALAECQLVGNDENFTASGGRKKSEFPVLHNPKRDRRVAGVVLPANTGRDGQPRGGRKLKAKDPATRKREGTYRSAGQPAAPVPATDSGGGDGRPTCRLPATWDQVAADFASGMGPPPLPVMGPP